MQNCMKRIFPLFLAICLMLGVLCRLPCYGEEGVTDASLSAKAAVLYEVGSGTFLISKNAEVRMPMASTTKIMTALTALSVLDPKMKAPFPERAVGVEGSSAYLEAGEILSIEDMLYALLLQSANDVAVALALLSDGSVEAFADRMNDLASSYGCQNTHFDNPHGLHTDTHYTTAKDLAVITEKLLEDELLCKIVNTRVYTAESSLTKRTFVNHNKLLSRSKDAVGVKTGFTKASGRCLVGAAKRDGLTLISVTLNAPNDWNDHEKMWEYAFSTYEYRHILKKEEYLSNLPVTGAFLPYVGVTNLDEVSFFSRKDAPAITMHKEAFPYLIAPVEKGDIVGELVFSQNGMRIKSIPLYARHSLPKAKI